MSTTVVEPRLAAGELKLRCVQDFLHERFLVPSYQRGYRWTAHEVHALLDDIRDFVRSDNLTRDSFYCLQPVVVLRVDGVCQIIDGQQRLTTIRLLLTFLKSLGPFVDENVQPYSIAYASLPAEHSAYLDDPKSIDGSVNIDLYHLREAYLAIESWFRQNKGMGPLQGILGALLNSNEDGKNVRVIWYELDERDQPIDVFVRLNIGKIELTDAELIRALLLNGRNFRKVTAETDPGEAPHSAASFRPYEIAQEWDDIERALQEDRYWHFLQGVNAPPTSRIELLFELIVRMKGVAIPDQRYGIFFAYASLAERARGKNGELNGGSLWWDVKRLALRLDEWFRDRRMYHLVGCLVSLASRAPQAGVDPREAAMVVLVDALCESEDKERARVRAGLRARIRRHVFDSGLAHHISYDALVSGLDDALGADAFQYSEQTLARERIRSVLLVFNVATHLRNIRSNLFFPFDAFQKQNWDIEHIRATMDRMPGRVDDQKTWIDNVTEYLGGLANDADDDTAARAADFGARAKALLEKAPFDSKEFEVLYREALNDFDASSKADAPAAADGMGAPGQGTEAVSTEGAPDAAPPSRTGDPDDGDMIFNLALLDSGTNRGIKHALFPIKRRLVLQREQEGLFVPVCTRNVFLKYYTQQLGQVRNMMYWNEGDRRAYGRAMVETLAHFFLED